MAEPPALRSVLGRVVTLVINGSAGGTIVAVAVDIEVDVGAWRHHSTVPD
jgi:hypothetical protein